MFLNFEMFKLIIYVIFNYLRIQIRLLIRAAKVRKRFGTAISEQNNMSI
jgi:hypothetical protein